MSNVELDPQERICTNSPSEKNLRGLSDGVAHHDSDYGVVDILEPRVVPLGGPRAMTVYRALPQKARSLIGAWCFADYYGPDDVAVSGGMDVPRHPHTGLATVSWLFEGTIDHIDSAGNWATVRPGWVNLMNAGRGITHSEYSSKDTTILHGLQLWYALPDEHRFSDPGLSSYQPPVIEGDGYQAKVFLGSLLGSTSPVTTYIPLTGAEFHIEPGRSVEIEVPADHEHGLVRVTGAVYLDGVEVPDKAIGFVGTGRNTIRISAGDEPVTTVLLGGEPLGEEIVMWWNFIGRSHEEVALWRQRYQQEMGLEPADDNSPAPTGESAVVRGELFGSSYPDGQPYPQYGEFPPAQPDPIPAPQLPNARLRSRS